MVKNKLTLLLAVIAGLMGTVTAGDNTVMHVAKSNGCGKFWTAVEKTDLMADATGESTAGGGMEPFTVFAPIDTAFDSTGLANLSDFPGEDADDPQADARETLEDQILGHVIPGEKFASTGDMPEEMENVNGWNVKRNGEELTGASGSPIKIVGGPFEASNGVVYKVDGILGTP